MTDLMDKFALKRHMRVQREDGREVTFYEISMTREATPHLYDLASTAVASWPGKWSLISVHTTPLCPAPWGGAPTPGIEYRNRIEAMVRRADEAKILGAKRVGDVPTGWVPVIERAVSGLVELMAHPSDRPAAITIRQVKEKFGTLRFYVEGIGSSKARACVTQISTWAEICSENRCMLTGAPGTLRQGDWLLTLSDDAVRLREADPQAFAARLYPDLE